MTFIARLRSWLRATARRSRMERDMDAELRFHIDAYTQDLVKRGAAPAAARRQALVDFGGVDLAKEECRDAKGLTFASSFVQDLRYGARAWRRNPGFTATALATLALGIGANATIFSWVQTVLVNPLPAATDASRVVALEMLTPSGEWTPTSYLDFTDFRDHLSSISAMSVAQPLALAVGNGATVERVWGELVSGNCFDLVGITPELGRFFTGSERDDVQNAHAAVVISHAFRKNRFRADDPVIGSTIRINRRVFTIVGVAPEAFHGTMPGVTFDLWIPATMYGDVTATGDWMLQDRKTRMFRVLARLAPGVSLEQARGELSSLAAFMAKADADTNEGMSATLLPIVQSHYGIQDRSRQPLTLLMGASGVVLLIVCANVANLLLARATGRRREFSIRLALGATRRRLIRQLLTEVLLLTAGASAAAIALAGLLSGSLRLLVPAEAVPTLLQPSISGGVLLFTAGVAFVTAALAGIVPAITASTEAPVQAIKEDGRTGSTGPRSARVRAMLVTAEVALAVVALVGSGLFLKNFYVARATAPGFDPSKVALARVNLSAAGFDADSADAFCRRLRERLEAQPGITAVTYADYVPLGLSSGSWEDLEIRGYVPAANENMKLYRNLVAPGYFGLMRIPILEGRDFMVQDDRASQPVMIVTREFVRRFLPVGDPIGGEVHGWGKWFRIVGVVEDAKIHRLTEGPTPYFYVPVRQIYRPEMGLTFFVRTAGAPDAAIATLQREIRAADPTVPIFDAAALGDAIGQSLFGERIAASLLSVLAAVAIVLAAIGLYGVMTYAVAQRTHEIGIRLTLGASPSDVLRMVAMQGLRLSGVGLAAGVVSAAFLGRAVSAMLPAISPADPSVYAATAVLTMVTVAVATAVPARRAMRVNPASAIR